MFFGHSLDSSSWTTGVNQLNLSTFESSIHVHGEWKLAD